MRGLQDKVAIVTGGASGIGRATAHRLAEEGMLVTVADVDGEGAARVAAEIGGGRARGQTTDVADATSVEAMVSDTVAAYGRLDVLHNNAAAIQLNFEDQDVVSMDLDTWDQVFAVNLRGVVLGCRFAIPHLLGGGGVIVNTASAAAFYGSGSMPAYAASKAALVSLTKSIATAYGAKGIRCNAVAPGIVIDESLQESIGGPISEHLIKLTAAHVLERPGFPEEVASTVAFLASDDAAFVTGETLRVDGGFTAHGPTYQADRLEQLQQD